MRRLFSVLQRRHTSVRQFLMADDVLDRVAQLV
jgi:hypothetical protein